MFDYLQLDEKLWDKNKRRQRKSTREITTHTSIHTLHLDGLRELFRHFLRLPDGAIVEVCAVIQLSKPVNSKPLFVLEVEYTAKIYEPAVEQVATILCCIYCSQLSTILFSVVKMNNIVQCC